MYEQIIPKLEALKKDSSKCIAVPKVYYADAENGILVMEHLKMKGFDIMDKKIGRYI